MDKQRLELLHRHKDAMSASLTAELDRFEQFCGHTKPRVAVLCADNHLRMEMEQILTPRTDMDVVLHGTYGEEWDLFEMISKRFKEILDMQPQHLLWMSMAM